MLKDEIIINSQKLMIIVAGSLIVGIIVGGLIGFTLAPSGGENFDLPEIDSFRMGFIPSNPEDVETITTKATAMTNYLEQEMGVKVEIYPVSNGYEELIVAFQNGQVDAAFLDGTPSSLVVQSGHAEVVMAELRSANNATFYNAAAWVRADSPIDSLQTMLNGNFISSHTSATGTAGMVMPIGTLINMGLMQTQTDDDTDSLLDRYFADQTIGGSYPGALLRVLDGDADVAFVRDTTPADEFPERQSELKLLHVFGQVPSHPVVVSTSLAEGWKYRFVKAMLNLNHPENVEILTNLYSSPGLVGANNLHLADITKAVEQLPWLEETILAGRG